MSGLNRLVTINDLESDLHRLGIAPGMTLIVHSSLSSIGWVCGGPQAVILALVHVLGPDGTLVMPTHSAVLSDPKDWCNPPVPQSWWQPIRETMPPYRADLTTSNGMGKITETFRGMNGVLRSDHPKTSFAAWGKKKERIVGGHVLDYGMGETSPLARLYDEDARVLLLGVGYDSCTAIHLAEYRADYPGKERVREGAPVVVDGERQWVEYDDVDLDSEDFAAIGADFEKDVVSVGKGKIGLADSRLIPLRALVDFAVERLPRHRREEE